MNLLQIEKTHWHALPYESLFLALHTSEQGITDQMAEARIKKVGLNLIDKKDKISFLKFFFAQFCSPLIYILLFSMLLAFIFNKVTDGLVILSVIILNTLIGAIQEYKSSCAIHALSQQVAQMALVIREGVQKKIPATEVTLGDVLVLEPGERICADVRLFSLKNLASDESILTGESLPVFKKTETVSSESSIADRKCIAYSGTLITSGYGFGVVFAVGAKTEFGKIASLIDSVISLKTPLSLALDRLGKWVSFFVVFIALGAFLTAFLRGYSLLEGAMTSIALGVAAIPEGLPAIITITAAIGVVRMAKKNTIVRQLVAVETLGSTTVICTDKTGTLTENKMKVCFIKPFSEEKEIVIASVLCNTAAASLNENNIKYLGDPTENALLMYANSKGYDEAEIRRNYPRLDLIPFDAEKRWMASFHQMGKDQKVLFIKGAPEEIIDKCLFSDLLTKEKLYQDLIGMATQGMRVLGIAKKELKNFRNTCDEEDVEEGFVLLGLVGMEDPARKGVDQAIKTCRAAGIKVKMITGDHPETAKKIAREIGLESPEEVLTGLMLDNLSENELEEKVSKVNVFARTLPHHKLKIVQLLQKKQEVVAMTGDGVNDAPSLKQADIGIAMGITGTSVAKEASDMILVDDNFKTIELAVEEGRHVYDNLIKSILFLFPTNLAQSFVVIVGVLFFPVYQGNLLLPILPVQILWVNLIVAVALALPLAFELIEPNIMQRIPRKAKSPILNKFTIIRIFSAGTFIMIGTITSFFLEYFFGAHKQNEAQSYAQTAAVTTLVFFQIFYLFKCRSFSQSLFKLGFFSNRYLLYGVGLVVLAQVGFVSLPFMQKLFHSCLLSIESWMMSLSIGVLIIPFVGLEKWILKKTGICE